MTEDALSFGRFRLDLARRQLYHDGEPVPLRNRAREILGALVSANGAVVTKEELMARVWPNRAVEESNLYVHIASLRKVLDAESSGRSCIITVARTGYRFAYPENESAAAKGGSVFGRVTREKLRIAVFPFRLISDQEDPGDPTGGFAEEIVTALSRVSWLSVILPSLAFSYRARTLDIRRVGSELGVRYVVDGSVRKSAGRSCVIYRLVEAKTGACLASSRFDGALDDVLGFQEKVAVAVTGAIEPLLQAAETTRSLARTDDRLTAHDLYLRGYAMAMSAGVRFREVLPLLERAIAQEPDYAPAPGWASVGCVRLAMDGRSHNFTSDCQRGTDHAWHALEMGRDDPGVISNCALTLGYVGEDIGATTALVDRALQLNPGHARGWHVSGMLRFFAGDLDAAIEHIETSMRLSSRTRVGWGYTWLGAAHFLGGRLDEGLAKLWLAIQEDPSFPDPYRFLAACYAHMNRLDKARQVVSRLRAVTPTPMPDTGYMRNGEHREMFVAGLKRAGADAVV